MKKPYQSLQNLLQQHTAEFGSLAQKSQRITQLNQLLKQCLPQVMAEHCEVVNIRQGILVIAATNASWHTRLRYMTTELLSQFRQAQPSVSFVAIHCIVRPKQTTSTVSSLTWQNAPVTENTIATLIELSDSVQVSALKETLQSIAQHMRALI
jgi:hypothetical protein